MPPGEAAWAIALLVALQEVCLQGLWAFLRHRGGRGAWGADDDAAAAAVPGLLAYQCVATAACLGCALEGCRRWFSAEIDAALPDHLNGSWGPAERLIIACSAFQFWNLSAVLRFPSLRRPEAIFHHAVAGVVAAGALWPYYQYYAVFYIGVPEVSAVLLFPVEVFKLFPGLRQRHPAANLAARLCFAVAHFVCRLGLWPLVTVRLLQDSVHALQAGQAAHPALVLLCMAVFVPMTGLQVYWGYLILKMAHRTARAALAGEPLGSPLLLPSAAAADEDHPVPRWEQSEKPAV